jgi:hypothetical protein
MTYRLAFICKACIALLLAGILVIPVAESYAQQVTPAKGPLLDVNYQSLSDDDILVLEVRLERKSTGRGLIAYQKGDKFLLPLGELSSILELAIMVDPYSGNAMGWVIEEDRTFDLSLTKQLITLSGEPAPLDPATVGFDSHDIYIEASVLEKWLPVDYSVNLPRMNIQITPRELLPFQSRLKRDEQRSYWLAGQGKNTMKYPLEAAPYRLWSWPLVDATMGFLKGRQTNNRRFTLQSSADIGGLSTNLFVSHLQNDITSNTAARLKAGRWNPEGKLLGPASATRYELGDLFISKVPLITTSKKGLGAMISNQSLTRSREFDTTEIQGDAPPGWEAELYINGSLYDFQTVGETGQFYFADVPMIVGNNTFRTVLYGPRGEKREIVKNANISPEMSDVGDLKYKAIIVKEGEGVFESPSSNEKAWNQQLELSYALSPKHALTANFSRLKVEGHQEFFSSLTSHNSLGRVYLETILAKSMRGGGALSLGARARLFGQNIFALYNVNENYRAEALYGQRYIKNKSILRSSGKMGSVGKQNILYNLSAINYKYEDSDLKQQNEIKFNLATSVNRFILSHNIRYLMKKYDATLNKDILGTQLVRTRIGPFSLRGDLTYELSSTRLRSSGVSINWFHKDRIQFSTRALHAFKPEFGSDNLSSDLTVFFDKFSLGANYSYFENSGPAIGITLGTSLTKDNRSSCYTVQHRRFANRSVASVRAFVDNNSNGVFDSGDDPLPDVGFNNLTAWRKIRTNKDGIALLTGLSVHQSQIIELDLTTVDDPFLIPLSKGANVVGHPGSFVDVEFPFSYMGEMEGMIYDGDASDTPVRHVGLEIMDTEGNQVMSTVGEFDGYYYFSKILPGDYLLGVIPSTVNSFRYEIPAPVAFTIPPGGGYITGPDVVLRHNAANALALPVIAALEPEVVEPEVVEPEIVEPEVLPTEVASVDKPEPASEPPVTESAQPEEIEEDDDQALVVAVLDTSTPESGLPLVVGAKVTTDLEKETLLARMAELSKQLGPYDFDEDLTLSLIYEVLHLNSLWPDEPAE